MAAPISTKRPSTTNPSVIPSTVLPVNQANNEYRKQQLLEQIGTMTAEISNLGRVVRDASERTIDSLSSNDKLLTERLGSNISVFRTTATEINKTHGMIEDIVDEGKRIYQTSEGALNLLKVHVEKISTELKNLTAADALTKQQINTFSEVTSRQTEKLTEKLAETSKTLRLTAEEVKKIVEHDTERTNHRVAHQDNNITESLNQIKTIVSDIRATYATNVIVGELKGMIGSLKIDIAGSEKRLKEHIDILRSDMTLIAETSSKMLLTSQETKDLIIDGHTRENVKELEEFSTRVNNLRGELKASEAKNNDFTAKLTDQLNRNTKLVKDFESLTVNNITANDHIKTLEKESKIAHDINIVRLDTSAVKHRELERKAAEALSEVGKYRAESLALRAVSETMKSELDIMKANNSRRHTPIHISPLIVESPKSINVSKNIDSDDEIMENIDDMIGTTPSANVSIDSTTIKNYSTEDETSSDKNEEVVQVSLENTPSVPTVVPGRSRVRKSPDSSGQKASRKTTRTIIDATQ